MRRQRAITFGAAMAVAALVSVASAPPTRALGLVAVANPDTYTVSHDRSLVVAPSGVLANDLNLSLLGTPAAVVVSPTGHGTISLAKNGGFTYTPTARFVGTDSFTYHITGGLLPSNTTTVTITVTNATPVARDDSYTATTGVTLSVSAPGVLGNDSDADGDALTATLVSGGGNGSLGLNANGSFTYTSGGSFVGTTSFTYRASDGLASSASATVTITVRAPSATPTPRPTPTPVPTPVPTPAPTPTPAPSLLPSLVPSIIPSLVPSIIPSLVPSSLPTILPPSAPTPAPPSLFPSPSAGPSNGPPVPSGDAPTPTPIPSIGPGGSAGPGAAGGGIGPGASPDSGSGGGGDRPLTVPGPDRADPVSIGDLSLALGGFQWLIPSFVLTVPGILLVLIVLAQLLGGGLFLPVARRALRGVGANRASGSRSPA